MIVGTGGLDQQPDNASYRVAVSRAPFRVQDVVQVVVTPFWHFLQAATHWSIAFGLYDGKFCTMHCSTAPVVSSSGRQAAVSSTAATNSAHRNMEHSSPWLWRGS
jgi:hypothetical protein